MRIASLPHVALLAVLTGSSCGPRARAFGGEKAGAAAAAARGASLYKTYCASCHGASGAGDGPMADQLRYRPADLTQLARRNHGTYPLEQVARIIDGRNAVKGHGGTDMPVWGDVFKNPRDGYDEKSVEEKVAQLAHFLASLQDR